MFPLNSPFNSSSISSVDKANQRVKLALNINNNNNYNNKDSNNNNQLVTIKDILFKYNNTINDSEELQSFLFNTFRLLPQTNENIDMAFSLLKEMNAFVNELNEKWEKRKENSTDEIMNKVKFRIGEVLQHKQLHYRGVVIGYYCYCYCFYSVLL